MISLKTLVFTNNNRAGLKRLINSIPEQLKESLYIFDDNSSYSLDFLKGISVRQNKKNLGLFANMKIAISEIVTEDDIVLILQDDVQFCYDMSMTELETYADFLVLNNFDMIDIRFIRSTGYSSYLQKNIRIDGGFYKNKEYPYTDIGLWKGVSLRNSLLPIINAITQTNFKSTSKDWGKEVWIGKQLGNDFKSCLHPNPFIAHTPFPRYRYNSLGVLLYQALSRISPQEFIMMSDDEWHKFKQRPVSIVPMDFLFLKTRIKWPLYFYPVQPNLKAYKSLLKHP